MNMKILRIVKTMELLLRKMGWNRGAYARRKDGLRLVGIRIENLYPDGRGINRSTGFTPKCIILIVGRDFC